MLESPTVILDGAHNPEGVQVLVEELKDMGQGRTIKLLFATMEDKEWEIMLRALASIVSEIVFTRVAMERSADPRQLAGKLNEPFPHRVFDDSRVALRALLDESLAEDIIVVAGSLYLLGEVRPMLQELVMARTAESVAATAPI
jgi:dihydrofolate synthase/folylpolyglutamate synthase